VPGYPADWVLELPCAVRRGGITPLPAAPLPLACTGLLSAVKAYELLTVEAAVHGDREAAYQALLAHPLGPESAQAQALLDEMLASNAPYLPQFFPEGRA
jgi:6-phospho-beta-glucosidase